MSSASRPNRGRILVIDDEKPVAELIRDILRRQGFTVTVSAGGEGALVEAATGDYDLVISDYAIPGLNGLEFARRLGARRPEVLILVVSGFLDVETVDALEEEPNVAGWLRKPFDIFDLMKRVEQLTRKDRAGQAVSREF